jgi:hypothetical protein
MTTPAINQMPCAVRHVRCSRPALPCDRCQQPAPRVWDTTRTAIDIDLDHPVLLQVTVSVHYCAACRHHFRLQPPFLRPDAVYTNRVVAKAVAAVFHDGMAVTRVGARLARDFWVRPSDAMIRRWCRDYTRALDFAQDYQPWVVAAFSGILCIDEVYQERLALLLAVDPAAPDGDRLIGYQLVHGAVDQTAMRSFLAHLRAVGVDPDQVVSDGSPLYPSTIAAVWPQAAHQLCLFHETRVLTKAVRQVIKAARAALPSLPPRLAADGGPPPTPDSPQAHAEPAPYRRGRGRCYTAVRQAGIATVHTLRMHGVSIQGIARQTGVSRMTVRAWLKQPPPPTANLDALPLRAALETIAEPAPPPAPWTSWAQVQQVRTAVGVDRYLLLRRPEHLTDEQRAAFAALFASPIGPPVRLARAFLEEGYDLWRDDTGARRPLAIAQERYARWRTNPAYATVPALRKMQKRMDDARFTQLSPFLRDPRWEGTNNGAERMGRTFRHLQAPRFGLRTDEAREGALVAHALHRHHHPDHPALPQANRCSRGRTRRERANLPMAA